jgi:tetratricopeptide (TPR) repeat protein
VSHRASWPLATALLLLTLGCSTPRIRIDHSCPPCIALDPKTTLGLEIVIDPAIGPEPSEMVHRELDRHLLRGPYPLVDTRSATVIVRARPVEWSFQWPLPPLPGVNGQGCLRVRIEVLHANNPNGPCIYSSTYWAKVHLPDSTSTLARAADMVVDRFAADLRPSRICNVVDMDDSDPRAETGIELCRCGRFDAAYSAFSDQAAQAPDSAPLLYNFAVLRESRGEYDAAESLLLRATKIDPKAIYYIALERVRAGKRDAEALGSTP